MCGIAGGANYQPHPHELNEAILRLKPRGPDAHGTYTDPHYPVFLIHTRLAIVDPEPRAHQPFSTHNHNTYLVYNGEVYNFQEIKKSWTPPTGWRTQSDTEVVAETIQHLQQRALPTYDGMYALAAWLRNHQTLLLARDPFGVKPLYFWFNGSTLLFASTLTALLAFKPVQQTTIAHHHLTPYLMTGFFPEPYTPLNHVWKLPAGTCLLAQLSKHGTLRLWIERWWTPQNLYQTAQQLRKKLSRLSPHQILNYLEQLLTEQIQKRLIADVPYGIFLSGGIDSSLITAIITHQLRIQPKTFTLAIQSPGFNEQQRAQTVAHLLQTQHQTFPVHAQELTPWITHLPQITGEPLADASLLPTLTLSAYTAQQVKMVLTGEGSDELFWGYGTFRWAHRIQPPQRLFWQLAIPIAKHLQTHWQRLKHLFPLPSNPQLLPLHLYAIEQRYFTWQELTTTPILPQELLNPHILPTLPPFLLNTTPEEQQSWWETLVPLKDDLLAKIDRATMAHSLEARVPFIDGTLPATFAMALPPHWKKRGHTLKYILRQLLHKYLPKPLINQPKWGFGIPLESWLQTTWKDMLALIDILPTTWALHKKTLRQIRDHLLYQNQKWLAPKLWLLLILALWTQWFQQQTRPTTTPSTTQGTFPSQSKL